MIAIMKQLARIALTIVGFLLVLTAGIATAQGPPTLQPLDNGRVPYFIAEAEAGSEARPGDHDLARWALQVWERTIGGALQFQPASTEREALLRVYFVPASSGQYGEMRSLTLDGKRGAAVFIRPDVTALGPDMASAARADALMRDTIVYLTCLHELGHAVGLSHTADFDDIMYFFGYGGDLVGFFDRYRRQLRTRDDIAKNAGLSPADARRVRALYAK
jgi:matrixin